MSVLKNKRQESKAEYVNTANKIYINVIHFLARLSARYSRLMAEDTAHVASNVIDNVEIANSIFPSDEERTQLRKKHLLEARGNLLALDVKLTHIYTILMANPEGCFTTSHGREVSSSEAVKKLNNMAEEIGLLIDSENKMLTALITNKPKQKEQENQRKNNK